MAVQTPKSRGLDTHEEIVHSDTAIALGIHIDLRHMLVSVAPMRLWRSKQGLRWALRCRALLGKNMEVLLEHMTFVALLRRDVLSVPFALNKFIRANYNNSARLWPSARANAQAFVGLLLAISDAQANEHDANAILTLLRALINIGLDLTLVVTLVDLIENDDAAGEMMLVPIDGFPEVPLEVVEASGWMDVASAGWRYRNENIIVHTRG